MADVTITGLPNLSPSTNTFVPISNGTTTGKAATSSLGGIPIGGIIMWNGTTPPAGWALCNGGNGTPNLVDRFIVATGGSYGLGAVGGSKDAIVVSHTHPFSVSGNTSTDGAHTHSGGASGGCNCSGGGSGAAKPGTTGSAGSHSHSFSGSGTTGSTGSSGTNANLPPYYALAFIMRIS